MTGMRYTWRTFARELTMLVIAAIWLIPFYFLVVMAVKPSPEIFDPPTALPSRVEWDNFNKAWVGSGVVSLGQGLKSSVIITVFSVLLLILLGSLAAYTLARRVGHLSTALYFLFVLGIILPFQLGIVPTYVALRHLGLTGSYIGLIVLYTGLLMPLTVFLYTGFVRTLPKDYEEAAQIDGAGLWRTYRRVVLPLLRPITATVAILTGLIVWNDFFLPLIFLSGTPKATTPVAIYSFVGEFATQWNFIFAAVIVAVAPILAFYVFAQRQLIHGFTGGIKS
jgi:raffinose/stachyose/melibiose transport system permease protein